MSKAVSKIALSYLNKEKLKLRKVLHINHSILRIASYLLPRRTSIKDAKFIFHARTRMLDVKTNFKNKPHLDLLCPLCRDVNSFDNQQHLLKCTSLMDSTIILLDGPVYEDLFSDDVMQQIAVANVLVTKFTKRKELLKTT